MHKLANTWIGHILNRLVNIFEMRVIGNYAQPEVLRLIRKVKHEDGRFLFHPSELEVMHSLAKACNSIAGDYAEVGVFRGTSACVIAAAKGDKHLYLFDTFNGLPLPGAGDAGFREHQFAASMPGVAARLKDYPKVTLCPGIFPSSGAQLRSHHFAFVHLDVDLYASTRDSLEFFYPRMNPGGIILSHDYAQAEGVHRAFDEFFASRPENVIKLPMSQCMVVCGMELSLRTSRRIEALLESVLKRPSLWPGNARRIVPGRSGGEQPRAKPVVLHLNADEAEWQRLRNLTGDFSETQSPERMVLVIHHDSDNIASSTEPAGILDMSNPTQEQ